MTSSSTRISILTTTGAAGGADAGDRFLEEEEEDEDEDEDAGAMSIRMLTTTTVTTEEGGGADAGAAAGRPGGPGPRRSVVVTDQVDDGSLAVHRVGTAGGDGEPELTGGLGKFTFD